MSSTKQLKGLMNMADKAINQMNEEITIFGKTLDESIKIAPEEDKGTIQNFKALTTKAFNLAKMGKADEAQELIRSFQHGSKDHKQTIP